MTENSVHKGIHNISFTFYYVDVLRTTWGFDRSTMIRPIQTGDTDQSLAVMLQ